eukprot:3642360-Pyramimonas_sp.AAC.1
MPGAPWFSARRLLRASIMRSARMPMRWRRKAGGKTRVADTTRGTERETRHCWADGGNQAELAR